MCLDPIESGSQKAGKAFLIVEYFYSPIRSDGYPDLLFKRQ